MDGDAHAGATVQHLWDMQKDPTKPNLRQVRAVSMALTQPEGAVSVLTGPEPVLTSEGCSGKRPGTLCNRVQWVSSTHRQQQQQQQSPVSLSPPNMRRAQPWQRHQHVTQQVGPLAQCSA